ncbi:hypothetical protein E2C01_087318 [Portunus trituberculatus]|uniref:Uncharacterized protein n=1 Tax=Portunus trituberculatus TaxID=210409 RepID=A0A5B7JBJ8_PORTR|nr:hypothetical protein [Portunus trituberculatus]
MAAQLAQPICQLLVFPSFGLNNARAWLGRQSFPSLNMPGPHEESDQAFVPWRAPVSRHPRVHDLRQPLTRLTQHPRYALHPAAQNASRSLTSTSSFVEAAVDREAVDW